MTNWSQKTLDSNRGRVIPAPELLGLLQKGIADMPCQKISEETRAKMRAAKLGTKHSEEARAKMRAANLGKKHSEETRAKIRKISEETQAKLRGWKHSEEARAKMRAASLGRKHTEETRAKMRATKANEEFRAKMRKSTTRRWITNGLEMRDNIAKGLDRVGWTKGIRKSMPAEWYEHQQNVRDMHRYLNEILKTHPKTDESEESILAQFRDELN